MRRSLIKTSAAYTNFHISSKTHVCMYRVAILYQAFSELLVPTGWSEAWCKQRTYSFSMTSKHLFGGNNTHTHTHTHIHTHSDTWHSTGAHYTWIFTWNIIHVRDQSSILKHSQQITKVTRHSRVVITPCHNITLRYMTLFIIIECRHTWYLYSWWWGQEVNHSCTRKMISSGGEPLLTINEILWYSQCKM